MRIAALCSIGLSIWLLSANAQLKELRDPRERHLSNVRQITHGGNNAEAYWSFDGKKIQNLYDFTYALRAKKPGQEVLVKVLRGDQTIEAKVLLTERK